MNIVKTYDYTDQDGKLLYQVCRLDPKDFRQRRPDGEGWVWNITGIEPVLYNLPLLNTDRAIFLCEGEKDADTLTSHGFIATTNAGGSNKWTPGLTQYFAGKNVVIVPDTDMPGRKRARVLARRISAVAKTVRVVWVEGKDVSEYMQEKTKEDFMGLVKASALWSAEQYEVDLLKDMRHAVETEDELALRKLKNEYASKIDTNRIKKSIDLRDYVSRTHTVKRVGLVTNTLCPFHNEKSPSCAIYEDHFYCYGCQESGDIFSWVMKTKNLDFKQALQLFV